MKLTQPQVKEFQALYKARFGTDIDDDTARHESMQLIRLVSMIQPRTRLNVKMDMEINGNLVEPQSHTLKRAGHGKRPS